MKILACLVLMIGLSPCTFAQSTPSSRRIFEADKVLPPFCEIHFVPATTVKGSAPYVRLAYIAEALASAQLAAETLKKGVEDMKASNSLTNVFEIQMQATSEAADYLHCAADIAYRYAPTDKDDMTSKSLLMIAFNQEAQAISDLAKSQKRRFTRADPVANDPKTAASDAEELSKIHGSQRDAASSILQVTMLALYKAIDPTDDGGFSSFLNISCSERSDLLQRIESTSAGIKTAYSQDAGISRMLS